MYPDAAAIVGVELDSRAAQCGKVAAPGCWQGGVLVALQKKKWLLRRLTHPDLIPRLDLHPPL